MEGLLSQVEMKFMMGDLMILPLRDVKADIRRIEQELSPFHFLALRAQIIYVKICASRAHNIEQQMGLIHPQLRRQFLHQVGDSRDL